MVGVVEERSKRSDTLTLYANVGCGFGRPKSLENLTW